MLPESQSPENRHTKAVPGQEQQEPCAEKRREKSYTEVPNAHAAGVGAMGRNDEKLPSRTDEEDLFRDNGPVY